MGTIVIVLGLDCSSTCIGYAVLDGASIESYGHYDLTGEIGERCERAMAYVTILLEAHKPALVVIESPVARFAKAVIPQARVSGAVLAVLSQHQALWQEVTPQTGKIALTGKAKAEKPDMVRAAADRLSLPISDIRTSKGKVRAHAANGKPVLSEDEADAIGLALAGLAVKVEKAAA